MIYTLFLYGRHSLRRAFVFPARSILALGACAIAWMALAVAVAELTSVEELLLRAGRLDGLPGYQLTMSKSTQANIASTRILPPTLVEHVQLLAPVFILQMRNSVTIADPKTARVSTAEMLFAGSNSDELESGSSFPRCALIQPGKKIFSQATLITIATNWRCQQVPLPSSLASLADGRTTNALVFPISAFRELAGRKGNENIVGIWFGQDNRHSAEKLIHEVKLKDVRLDLVAMGAAVIARGRSLSSVTYIWATASAVFLAVGIGMYIQGVFHALRREAALRVSIGQRRAIVFSWLHIDILSQLLAAISISFVIAAALMLCLKWEIPWKGLGDAALRVTAICSFISATVGCLLIEKTFFHKSLITLTK